jgi:hypothetical protein
MQTVRLGRTGLPASRRCPGLTTYDLTRDSRWGDDIR